MESKHTKGPWILYTRTTLPPMIGSTEHIVCEVLSAPTREEEDANAKLIAAATDLLEALERLETIAATVRDAINAAGMRGGLSDDMEELDAALLQTDAVISKAS